MLPFEQLERLDARAEELLAMMADPAVATDPDRLREIGQERAEIEPVVSAYREYRDVAGALEATMAMREGETDPEMLALVESEAGTLEDRRAVLEAQLEELLLPKDPRDGKDVIVEVRARAGGDEAGLFAADLYRMYGRYAEARRWKVEVISRSETGIGGFKEIIFEVRGRDAYSRLKWESGVHRVQRVPETEASGRIHTSTASVNVLAEMDEIAIDIPESDIRMDVFRSSGPGGQSVNTTDSAVRLTHVPTGIIVQCQDQKSQLQNRRKAMQVLHARLAQDEMERQLEALGAERRSQVKHGDRAEKIRTYNYPQNRVTDHRIGLTVHHLERVLEGDLDQFMDALAAKERAELLEAARGR